jgi:thiol-disulfide isomerase/thioredoxin
MNSVLKLSSNSFDEQLNLVDPPSCKKDPSTCLRYGKVVILVYRPGCPHCDIYHPTFVQAAKTNTDPNLRFAELNTTDNPDFLGKVNSVKGTIEFEIQGVPTVLGYQAGSFYSVYGASEPSTGKKFRSVEDTLEYGNGIGSAPIIYE